MRKREEEDDDDSPLFYSTHAIGKWHVGLYNATRLNPARFWSSLAGSLPEEVWINPSGDDDNWFYEQDDDLHGPLPLTHLWHWCVRGDLEPAWNHKLTHALWL